MDSPIYPLQNKQALQLSESTSKSALNERMYSRESKMSQQNKFIHKQEKRSSKCRIKLQDYMRLSYLTKRSRSKVSGKICIDSQIERQSEQKKQRIKLNKGIKRQENKNKRDQFRQHRFGQRQNYSSKKILKQDILKKISQLQRKLKLIENTLQYKEINSQSQISGVIQLCQIQRILQCKILQGIEQIDTITKTLNSNKINQFVVEAKNYMCQHEEQFKKIKDKSRTNRVLEEKKQFKVQFRSQKFEDLRKAKRELAKIRD